MQPYKTQPIRFTHRSYKKYIRLLPKVMGVAPTGRGGASLCIDFIWTQLVINMTANRNTHTHIDVYSTDYLILCLQPLAR